MNMQMQQSSLESAPRLLFTSRPDCAREVAGWAVLAAAAVGLAYGFSRRRLTLADGRGIHVRESIRVEKPVAEVFRFWRRLENLPRFMTYLEGVTELGNGRSHWVARGPGSMRVEWDAEIINEVENKVIGWRSLPGSDVVIAGSVTFSPVRAGRSTQVAVHLQYATRTGRAGAIVAAIAGREPSQTIREELRRVKHLLEAGEIPRTAPEPQDVASGFSRTLPGGSPR